jgi:hypothetical protein
MRERVCDYCRANQSVPTNDASVSIMHNFGILSCKEHGHLARRDCNAYLGRIGRIRMVDAEHVPEIKRFLDILRAQEKCVDSYDRCQGLKECPPCVPSYILGECSGVNSCELNFEKTDKESYVEYSFETSCGKSTKTYLFDKESLLQNKSLLENTFQKIGIDQHIKVRSLEEVVFEYDPIKSEGFDNEV